MLASQDELRALKFVRGTPGHAYVDAEIFSRERDLVLLKRQRTTVHKFLNDTQFDVRCACPMPASC